MSLPSAPAIEPAEPHDRCRRCGRPTPLGVSLCEEHNPGHLKTPSPTQVHGTILAAVGVGFVALALLANYVLSGLGPFPTEILSASATAGGGVDLVFAVTNEGAKGSRATCRITRGGLSTVGDPVFRTDPMAPGARIEVARTILPPAPGEPTWTPERLVITCT